MAGGSVTMHVNVADLEKEVIGPFKSTAEQIRKAERMAIKDALKSTRGKGRKRAAEEYAIKPAGKKKLTDKIRLAQKGADAEAGELTFSGYEGTELHYFPGYPAKTPAEWLKRGNRPGLNPRLRKPKEGVRFQVFKGGRFRVEVPQGPRFSGGVRYVGRHVVTPARTFWIHLKDRRKWVLAYRTRPSRYVGGQRVKGGLSRKGLFAASMIQAIGRRDILHALGEHAAERVETRLEHYLDVYTKGILK